MTDPQDMTNVEILIELQDTPGLTDERQSELVDELAERSHP